MTKDDENLKITSQEILYDGFIKLSRVTADMPSVSGGRLSITREVHDHGNAVAVLPVDKSRGKALLIGQWRIPVWLNDYRQRLWEAPAGIIDDGEAPEDCAVREVLEETGYNVTNLRLVCSAFPSPGLITEKVHIYLADYNADMKVSTSLGIQDEGEDIELKEFTFDELYKMMQQGEMIDAVTIIAIYALRDELADG